MTCLVKSCRNVQRLLPVNTNITFHRFPKNKEKFKLWMEIIGRSNENKSWTPNLRLCSDHFRSTDFMKYSNRTYLKKKSVPIPISSQNRTSSSSSSSVVPIDEDTSPFIKCPTCATDPLASSEDQMTDLITSETNIEIFENVSIKSETFSDEELEIANNINHNINQGILMAYHLADHFTKFDPVSERSLNFRKGLEKLLKPYQELQQQTINA